MIDFKSLGYEDITKENPIHFIECFGETFVTIYPYEQRFRKEENGIITLLNVGTHRNATDISGICYHSKGWQKFEVHTLSKNAKEEFDKIINAVMYNIKNSY